MISFVVEELRLVHLLDRALITNLRIWRINSRILRQDANLVGDVSHNRNVNDEAKHLPQGSDQHLICVESGRNLQSAVGHP